MISQSEGKRYPCCCSDPGPALLPPPPPEAELAPWTSRLDGTCPTGRDPAGVLGLPCRRPPASSRPRLLVSRLRAHVTSSGTLPAPCRLAPPTQSRQHQRPGISIVGWGGEIPGSQGLVSGWGHRYQSAYSLCRTTDRPESGSFKQHRVPPLRVSAGTWGCSGAGPALQSAGQSLPSTQPQTRLLPRPTCPSVAACPVGTVGLRVSTAMER